MRFSRLLFPIFFFVMTSLSLFSSGCWNPPPLELKSAETDDTDTKDSGTKTGTDTHESSDSKRDTDRDASADTETSSDKKENSGSDSVCERDSNSETDTDTDSTSRTAPEDTADTDTESDNETIGPLPKITNINGNGSDLDINAAPELISDIENPKPASNRFRNGWIITGQHLHTVKSILLQSNDSSLLFSNDATEKENRMRIEADENGESAILFLPTALTSGRFKLVLENKYGEASAEVCIVKGERGRKGIDGSPGKPGEDGIEGERGVGFDCNQDTCVLPNQKNLLLEGNLTSQHASFTEISSTSDKDGDSVPDCPRGYTLNTDVTEYTLCRKEMAPNRIDEMVKVGDFWIDRYETSVWQYPDCTGNQHGVRNTQWPNISQTGSDFGFAEAYGCSLGDVFPSRFMTWFLAAQSCYASNKYLCSNAEWQAAALGTPDDQIAPTPYDDVVCNIWDGIQPMEARWAERGDEIYTGTAIYCKSNTGAMDMIGNVSEWVDGWRVGGIPPEQPPEDGMHRWMKSDYYNDDAVWGVDGRALDTYASGGGTFWKGVPVAIARYGSWENGAAAGVYSTAFYSSPTCKRDTHGTRCCRRW